MEGGLARLKELPQGGAEQLCAAAIKFLLHPSQDEVILSEGALASADKAAVSTLLTALSSALLESARSNADGNAMRLSLEERGCPREEAAALSEQYSKARDSLRLLLSRSGFSHPQLTGVTWRLDHVVKSRHLDHIDSPLFFVRLLTTQPDGKEGAVEMACSLEQLQDLHDRLADAARQVERTLSRDQ